MKIILLLPLVFLLSSCSYTKPIVIIPSDQLLEECSISTPPSLTGNDARDKVLLASAWTKQTTLLGQCNDKLKMLQLWKRTQQERYGMEK